MLVSPFQDMHVTCQSAFSAFIRLLSVAPCTINLHFIGDASSPNDNASDLWFGVGYSSSLLGGIIIYVGRPMAPLLKVPWYMYMYLLQAHGTWHKFVCGWWAYGFLWQLCFNAY